MTAGTITLADFLLARIAEDEAAARMEWEWERPHWAGCERIWVADHHDPECTCNMQARVLAECAAHRAIVEEHFDGRSGGHTEPWCATCSGDEDLEYLPCPTLRHLAAVYADHPDYRSEWRVG